MSFSGDVEFTILDGQAGIFSGPPNAVQCVIGTCTAGGTASANEVIPTRDPATLATAFLNGPLPEAAGLVLAAGGTVLAVKATTSTAGVITGTAQATTVISGVAIVVTNARITYSAQTPHVLQSGDVVTIAGVVGSTEVNGTWPITVIDATHFEIGVTVITPYVSDGTVEWTGAISGGGSSGAIGAFAGTAAPYFTGTPNDTYYVQVVCQTAFTVGTAGGAILVSLDAGRNYGQVIATGTSTTIALSDSGGAATGLTLNLGGSGKTWTGGGVVSGVPAGDFVRCSTVEPLPSASGIATAMAAVNAYLADTEAAFPLFQITGIYAASDATTLQSGGSTNLNSLAAQYLFERLIMPTRDVSPPSAWGGTGETEATWSAAVLADFASTVTPRVCATAGYYNMPTAFPMAIAGPSSYRRPFSFALAARQVAIEPQRHAGKVGNAQGGSLIQIVSSARQSTDGFVYHNELLNPAFDYLTVGGTGRIATARTRPRKPGWFASNPLLLASSGSDFTLLPRGIVMDVACTLAHQALEDFVYNDLTTKANGTLSDAAAGTVRAAVTNKIQPFMVAVGMISNFSVAVDQTQNIQITQKLEVRISILGVVYVLQVDAQLGYTTALAAPVTPA